MPRSVKAKKVDIRRGVVQTLQLPLDTLVLHAERVSKDKLGIWYEGVEGDATEPWGFVVLHTRDTLPDDLYRHVLTFQYQPEGPLVYAHLFALNVNEAQKERQKHRVLETFLRTGEKLSVTLSLQEAIEHGPPHNKPSECDHLVYSAKVEVNDCSFRCVCCGEKVEGNEGMADAFRSDPVTVLVDVRQQLLASTRAQSETGEKRWN